MRYSAPPLVAEQEENVVVFPLSPICIVPPFKVAETAPPFPDEHWHFWQVILEIVKLCPLVAVNSKIDPDPVDLVIFSNVVPP